MKTVNMLMANNGALLVGTEDLDFYLKGIGWNLRTMMGQADVLETTVLEMKKQVRASMATEQMVE